MEMRSDWCQKPCAAPISGLFVSGNLHYLHVKCCLVHHRKLNHGRFCISIWILRQKLRLINNKVLFCIFCNEFYCCCWPISERKPVLHLGWSWSGVTQCLPNQFQTSKSNNNHVIVIKISPVDSRAGEAFSGGWGVSSLKLTIYREPNSISNIFIISGNFPRLSWWSLELLGKLSLFGWSLSSLINYFPKPFSKISPQFVSKVPGPGSLTFRVCIIWGAVGRPWGKKAHLWPRQMGSLGIQIILQVFVRKTALLIGQYSLK